MASFLAARGAAVTAELPDTLPDPVGARALQARLTTELSGPAPASDAELLALYREYRQARKEMHRVFAERCDSDIEARALTARRDALVRTIATMRAATPRGFGIKMDVLRSCGCAALETVCPQSAGDLLLQSIASDSYWLFGAGDALLSQDGRPES
jgi:hypothetical protein